MSLIKCNFIIVTSVYVVIDFKIQQFLADMWTDLKLNNIWYDYFRPNQLAD
jgi:hypothetical protein